MPRIKESSINELKERIDAKALVEVYMKLELRGDKWWGCCPFHGEKTPSFNLDAQRGVYYCFGCNKGGSIINFIMEIERLNFVEALEFIAKRIGYRLQYEEGKAIDQKDNTKDEILSLYAKISQLFHRILVAEPQGKNAREYLKMRGITDESIEKFILGYAPSNKKWLYSFLVKKNYSKNLLKQSGLFSPKYPNIAFFSNRLMFPICDRYGLPIAFGGRTLTNEMPKYINSKDMEQYKKGHTLFAFSYALQSIRKEKKVILCEGYMDVIAYHQAGITYAVAPLGTALTEHQVGYLKNLCDEFYLSFDSDDAGQKATERAILMIRKASGVVYIINVENEKDPADILKNEGKGSLSLLIKNAILDVDYLLLVVNKKFDTSTYDGRIKALSFFFPFLASLSSNVYKEEAIKRLAIFIGSSESAILSDYDKYLKGISLTTRKTNSIVKKNGDAFLLKKTMEIRLLLSVIKNRKLFIELRSKVRVEDFAEPVARTLYIALEECFREDKEGIDELLVKFEDENLALLIKEAALSSEFESNSPDILLDGIRLINLNRLKKKRGLIVNKIRNFDSSADNSMELRELLMEKNELDNQIFTLNNMERNESFSYEDNEDEL